MQNESKCINGADRSAALVVLGWICVIASAFVGEPIVKIPLLAAARVLPQASSLSLRIRS